MLKSNHLLRILFLFTVLLIISCNSVENPEKENIPASETPQEEEVEVAPEVELFERLDILGINQRISEAEEPLSPSQIMKMYYPTEEESSEGKESVDIKENVLEHEEMEVVLIHDYQMDDSVKGAKYIMVLKKQGEDWKVVSLKKNWKCYKGRGHTFWGIDTCS